VLAIASQTIAADIAATRMIEARIPGDVAAVVGDHPVEIHASARIFPNVVLDAEQGPIIVHEHATIRAGAVICGPCSIGAGSTIIDRALIKANTVIGPQCKVAGEVGSTIFQGYSNKAHDGHLGDSWVGKWVNFGAGTTNSNLLNTYGEVIMRLDPDSPRLRTGMQFLGAIVGDHAKFAICTRLMTGSIIGTGAMIATTAPPPTTVTPFAWLTDEAGPEGRTFRLEKFIEIAKTVMARRKVTPSETYLQLVRELHSQQTQAVERPLRG
jgi:UDP-N-acetylglucosamine diphosphorylase/glucosamine-1-phosphate N-acetyltransferase